MDDKNEKFPGTKTITEGLSHRRDLFVRDAGSSNPQEYIKHRHLFEELPQKYGIPIPRFDLIRGPFHGEDNIKQVADKVEGLNLTEPDCNPPVGMLEDLTLKLTAYIDAKYKSGEDFVWDIHTDQFIYGTTKHEKIPQIYFVDIEPTIRNGDFLKDHITDYARTLFGFIKFFESRNPGNTFQKARETLRKFIEQNNLSEELLRSAPSDFSEFLETTPTQ